MLDSTRSFLQLTVDQLRRLATRVDPVASAQCQHIADQITRQLYDETTHQEAPHQAVGVIVPEKANAMPGARG